MGGDVYDSDDARGTSPPPQPQRPNYEPRESPPPFLKESSESPDRKSSDERDRKRVRRRRKRKGHSISDLLILRNLGPDRPDLIKDFEQDVYDSYESDSDRKDTADGQEADHDILIREKEPEVTSNIQAAREALVLIPDEADNHTSKPAPDQSHTKFRHDHDTGTLPTSPRLATITPFERSRETPSQTLPPLQSPPNSISGSSPEASQTLPSIQDTLSVELQLANKNNRMSASGASPSVYPVPGSSPPRPHFVDHPIRHTEPYAPPPIYSVPPYSHISPPDSKKLSDTPPTSRASPYRQLSAKNERSHMPSPSQLAENITTSYPTPTEPTQGPTETSLRNQRFLPNGPLNSTGFKCLYPGCNAAPFQTQYLLNSHANVHSQERPYFCDKEGCNRGVGGKGFKRKNELMRHGLVHESPGYVCPFCPDQQHSYPRPDNLQRHVRFHHVDKDRNDPVLRNVLSQRPEGGLRGRRRRNGL